MKKSAELFSFVVIVFVAYVNSNFSTENIFPYFLWIAVGFFFCLILPEKPKQ